MRTQSPRIRSLFRVCHLQLTLSCRLTQRTDPNLLAHNLDVLENGMPTISANLSKNVTVPSVSGGILWPDEVNQVFYLYGGEYPLVPEEFALWAYDVPMDQWNLTTFPPTSSAVKRVAWGAGTTVQGRAEGYYYGGYMNNRTNPGWDGPPLAMSNLVKYDMIANRWTNNTGPDSTGRAEGVMVTIPASRQGMLVYFGGVSFPYGNSTEVAVSHSRPKIHIFFLSADAASSHQ